jgi:prophage antirepressor-like protein
MANELRPFDYQGYQVRTIIKDGEPWFVAKDVCDVLNLGNVGQAISRLDDDEKNTIILNDGTPGNPNMAIVNEAGLYSLILSGRKPEAREFKRWVTHEVLPSIRKTGGYGQYRLPQSYTEALRMLADEVERREQLEQQHQAMLPKAEQFDFFMSAKGAQAMNVVAKSLGTGRTRLFEILRSEGVLMSNNTPYQDYLERGYFKVVEKPIRMGDVTFIKPQTLVTPKGVDFISKMLANRGKVLPLAK